MDKIVIRIDKEIEELIPAFLEARLEDCRVLPELVQKKDYETIVTIGHGMRGSGGGYGFDEITRIGEVVESAGREKVDEKILESVTLLKAYLDAVEITFI